MVKEQDPEEPVLNAAIQPVEPPAEPDMEQLFRRHSKRVLTAAYRVTGSAHDAEDVLQTVFMRLVRRNGTRLAGDPTAYLHRAAINAALDLVRSKRASRSSPLEDIEPMLAAPEGQAPDRVLSGGEVRDEVRKALTRLSPKSAEIFALRYFEGYDNHEIAGMLGSSRSTVAVILHRARKSVREAIGSPVGDES